MSQQPSIYTPGGYQSRRCLLLSVPFGGQDFRNAYGDFRRDRWGTRHRWSEDRWHGQPGFSTGSHLQFELYPTGSGAVDPLPWFAEHGVTF